jgi:hypothetical protein
MGMGGSGGMGMGMGMGGSGGCASGACAELRRTPSASASSPRHERRSLLKNWSTCEHRTVMLRWLSVGFRWSQICRWSEPTPLVTVCLLGSVRFRWSQSAVGLYPTRLQHV